MDPLREGQLRTKCGSRDSEGFFGIPPAAQTLNRECRPDFVELL